VINKRQLCAHAGLQNVPQEPKTHGRALLQIGSVVSLPPFPGAFSAHPVADASVYAAASAYEAAAFAASQTGTHHAQHSPSSRTTAEITYQPAL